MKDFKNTPMNMNDALRFKLEEDIVQLKQIISEKIKKSYLNTAVSSWINGILNVLDSKVLSKSTIDDLQWFYSHGMADCERILDIGCGAGNISLMIHRMGKDVIGYEYIGKWVGQEHTEDDYRESFSLCHTCVKQIAQTGGGGSSGFQILSILSFGYFRGFH